MTDWLGPLQAVTIASSLWLILAFPLAAALFCTWAALARRTDERMTHAIGVLSTGAMGLAFIASAWHAFALASMPAAERFLLEHLFRMARIGQLDASFDLALDPLSSTMTLVVTGVGALIFVYSAKSMEDDASYARFFAWLNLFVLSMLLLVLADNLLLMFFGWEGVGLSSWGLIGFWFTDESKARAGAKAFLVNRVGDAGFLLGIAVLFWGLGGAWEDGEYAPDLEARFASVEVVSSEAEIEERAHATDTHVRDADRVALLTMTSYSGAVVYMDDARRPLERAPGVLLRAPFSRLPVPAGVHTFRVHPGAGLEDSLVPRVAMSGGREVAIAAVGPSLVFRTIEDELSLRDPNGRPSFLGGLLAKRGAGRMSVITLACLLLFLGAVGKSAQIPLHVWLPDAMAGPTPVSALIHAATMVTAGVYMIARLGFLFALSSTASTVVACTGALTAILTAAVGAYQYDLKRILAFSTISQLGLMIVAGGVGAHTAGMFHLVTHAFMKACLFLAAGSVIAAMVAVEPDEAASQDVRKMGGLARVMPRTARAYRIACIAITAAPIPGLAGFWSKDDIFVQAFVARGLAVPGPAFGAVIMATAGVTSFTMWRSYYLAFEGPARADAEKLHESDPRICGVLEILAGLSAVSGIVLGASARLFGKDVESALEAWLAPVVGGARMPSLGLEWGIILAGYGIALAGWALARAQYGESRAAEWEARERRSAMFGVLSRAFALDVIYDAIFVRGVARVSEVATEVDRWVIDGAVHGVALLTRAVAWMAGRADDAIVDGAVDAVARGTLGAGARFRALQTGRIQTYVYLALSGLLALAALQYWLR